MNPDLLNSSNRAAQPIDCSNPQDQQELNQCSAQSYEAADRELQTLYDQMEAQTSEPGRSQLATAEQEWLEFRAAQCRLEAKPNEGGSLYPTVFYRCMERMTRDRIKQMQDQRQSNR